MCHLCAKVIQEFTVVHTYLPPWRGRSRRPLTKEDAHAHAHIDRCCNGAIPSK